MTTQEGADHCEHCHASGGGHRHCRSTQEKEGWESVWADFTNHIRTNEEVKDFIRRTREEAVAEDRKALREALLQLRKSKHDDIPSATDWGRTEDDRLYSLIDCSAQDAECYNAALTDAATLLTTHDNQKDV